MTDEKADPPEKKTKAWYKHGWGLLLAICIWPLFLCWYIWVKSEWGKKRKFVATTALAIVCIIIGASVSSPNNATKANRDNNDNNNVSAQHTTNTDKPLSTAPETTNTTTPSSTSASTSNSKPVVPAETLSQRNAVSKAKEYLSVEAFSHDGLIDQLEYDQFSVADATYGADNSGGDWNQQAAKKAQEYLSVESFSHAGLISQLEYDKFTPDQATYGVNAVGL